MKFLGSLPQPPTSPGQLTADHLEAFYQHRARTTPATALRDLGEARLLLTRTALRDMVSAGVLDHIQRRLPAPRDPAPTFADSGVKRLTTGYSDGELARLLAALRADVAGIRDRIRSGEDLLRRYRADPLALAEPDRDRGRLLDHMATTGQVPHATRDPGQPDQPATARTGWAVFPQTPGSGAADAARRGAGGAQRRDDQGASGPAPGAGGSGGGAGHRQAPPRRAALVRDRDLGDRAAGSRTAYPRRLLPADAGTDRPQPHVVHLAAVVVCLAQRVRGPAWRR